MPNKPTIHLVLSLQQNKLQRNTLCAYIVESTNIEGVFSIVENISKIEYSNSYDFGSRELEIIKCSKEISDAKLLNFFGKNMKSQEDFIKKYETDSSLSEYVNGYIDRRISKCISIASESAIPLYKREKNINKFYPQDLLNIEKVPVKPIFIFNMTPNEFKYSIGIELHNKRIDITTNDSEILTNQPCVIRIRKHVYLVENVDSKKISPFLSKKFVTIPQTSKRKYLETFVLNTIKNQKVEASGFYIIDKIARGKPVISLENRLMGGKCFVLSFMYDGKSYTCNTAIISEVKLIEENGEFSFRKTLRDAQWEKQFTQLMQDKLGLKKVGDAEFLPIGIDQYDIDNECDVIEWINYSHKLLAENGVEIIQKDKDKNFYLNEVNIELKAKSENDWFDLYGTVSLGDFQIPFINLKRYILHNIREFKLPNGQFFILPKIWFTKYRTIFQVSRENETGLKVAKSLINLLVDNDVDSPTASGIIDDIKNASKSKITLPQNINATLRNYQKIGFAWLAIISKNRINGCLADDMGLGKTLQTITLLQHVYETGKKNTSLIVAPTSLIHNWQSEFTRFTPNLKVLSYTGTMRSKLVEHFFDYDIVLTSYGLLRNDIEVLRNIQFNYLILDESQNIKNPASKIYRAAILMNANRYLSLSGTPIENSLIDLWAQMNFLNRGMLGSLRNFRNEFQIPIEKHDDDTKKQQLKRLIEPLIMRRSKEEVADDLPPITEQLIECEMSETQAEIYEKEKSAIRHAILSNIESAGIEKSAINILSGLTRLRQIANHPALLPEYPELESGKFDEIIRCLTNIVDEGHKILVFSSFVRYLELVKLFLEDKGIGYEMLTGTSTNRGQIVENFQLNTKKKVFLISLKAGGVGLNLTAADYVFVLDPWWNPAAEMQATARAHRIGQNKNVFVYRFISGNTVEDKIVNMQNRKEKLAQLFVNESNPMNIMDKEMIMELLE